MLVGHVLEAVLNGDLSALLPSALSSISDGAEDALKEKLNEFNSAKDVMKDLKDWAKNQFENWMPDADGLERVEKDINDLLLRTYKPGGRMSFPTSETPYRTRWTAARFRRKPTAAWVKPMTFLRPMARFLWTWGPCREWERTRWVLLAAAMGVMETPVTVTEGRGAPGRAKVEPHRSAGPAPVLALRTQVLVTARNLPPPAIWESNVRILLRLSGDSFMRQTFWTN